VKVSVAIAEPVPEIAAGCVTEQPGAPVVPAGLEVTAQVRVTVPVKPPLGATVMAEVAVLPCGIVGGGIALSENVPDPV
jgi:hypothetical protein